MLIYQKPRSIRSRLLRWSDTYLVEHLSQFRQCLFNLFDILITLLDFSEGSSRIAVSVGVKKLLQLMVSFSFNFDEKP
jgi:hypothetical protein